ncbi:MAG TPA: hypothetical protein ENI64_11445 [Gammaproteobacteria bacterium]|nr:hypothetical protein [Gammaproteobacteria bacterium]
MSTLRKNLTDTLNELQSLMMANITDEQRETLRKRIRILFAQLDEVLVQDLSDSSDDFNQALAALQNSAQAAEDAKNDIDKVASVINKTADAIGKLEKVLKMGIKIVA